jgi:multiple sugar transport system permease protein
VTRTLISPARLNRPAGRRIYWALVITVVVAFSVAFLGPLYWMVTGGLKTGQEIAQVPPTLFPADPDPGNYADAWTNLELGRLLLNTVWYAFGALAFQLVFGVTAAVRVLQAAPGTRQRHSRRDAGDPHDPVDRTDHPAVRDRDRPADLRLEPAQHTLGDLAAAVANAFNIFLLKRFFDSIPNEMLQAAAIDGAGPVRLAVVDRAAGLAPDPRLWSRSSR